MKEDFGFGGRETPAGFERPASAGRNQFGRASGADAPARPARDAPDAGNGRFGNQGSGGGRSQCGGAQAAVRVREQRPATGAQRFGRHRNRSLGQVHHTLRSRRRRVVEGQRARRNDHGHGTFRRPAGSGPAPDQPERELGFRGHPRARRERRSFGCPSG